MELEILGWLASFSFMHGGKKNGLVWSNEWVTQHVFFGYIISIWKLKVYDIFLGLLSCLRFLLWLEWLICSLFLFVLQLQEKQRLIDFAEALRSKLNYFDELENVRFDCWLDWIFFLISSSIFSSFFFFFWFNDLIACYILKDVNMLIGPTNLYAPST